jgi:hypothetical protein
MIRYFVPRRLSQAPCHFGGGIFPAFAGFLCGPGPVAGAAEFAAPARPARLFVLSWRVRLPKSSTKSLVPHLARTLRLAVRAKIFLRIINRITLRASVSDIPGNLCCEPPGFSEQSRRQ